MGVQQLPGASHVPLGCMKVTNGEPQHETPELIRRALVDPLNGLSVYPSPAGLDHLRAALVA